MYRISDNSLAIQGRLIDFVYEAYGVDYYQISGGPSWTKTDYYDVVAKASTAVGAKELRAMLQTLLADRFHMKLHRETKTLSGYTLTLDKGGAKLPPPRTDLPPDSPGSVRGGRGSLASHGATMKVLADLLTRKLKQPVIDQTSVTGNYDYTLSFEEGPDMDFGGLFSALHDIGVRLEARKLPFTVLVIDSVDKPTEN